MVAKRKHYPLPKRFNAAMSEEAYERLRELSGRYGLSNNYLLTVLLEKLDTLSDAETVDKVFRDFIAEHCPPPQK